MKIKDYKKFCKVIEDIEIINYEMSKDNYRCHELLSECVDVLIDIRNIIEEE